MKSIYPILAGVSRSLFTSYIAFAKKTNILIIVADDMGYSDAGCYGSEI